jgi:hypothetical protein
VRIAFLYDNSPTCDTALDLVAYGWIGGLVESQHQVKVVTSRHHSPPPTLSHPRLEWAQAMNRWSWLEVPRLLKTVMPFDPQLIHLVLCRPLQWGQLWSMGSAFKAWRIPLLVSMNDGIQAPLNWPFIARIWTPEKSELKLPPVPLLASMDARPLSPNSIFVPGPLGAHEDWRRSLRTIFAEAKNKSKTQWHLGWDWSEISLPERLEWRAMASELLPGQLICTGSITMERQLQLAKAAGEVRLDLLKPTSWTYGLLAQSLVPQSSGRLDSAINQLSRAYLQATQRPWHS